MSNSKINVLDLFAGAGGFSLGFEEAGFNVISAVEIDKWASDTLKRNHPNTEVITKDIVSINNDEAKKLFESKGIDVIIGGPPCQGFSIANKNAGDPKDPRNSLFREFIRLSSIVKPRVIVMENVPNLLKAKNEEGTLVIDIIVQEFLKIGYEANYRVLNAAEFGVPQVRNRLFVIATKVNNDNINLFPSTTHVPYGVERDLLNSDLPDTPTTWEAISDLPIINAREGAEEMLYDTAPQNNYQILLRMDSQVVYNHKAMNHTKRMVERFQHMPVGVKHEDIPEELRPRKRGNSSETGSFYGQNNRRMAPNKQCHTITASFYANFIHPFNHRNFTPREGARIQSFPDWYKFEGKPTVVSKKLLSKEGRSDENYLCQYNQIGNAVPPLLAKKIAQKIRKELFTSVCSRS